MNAFVPSGENTVNVLEMSVVISNLSVVSENFDVVVQMPVNLNNCFYPFVLKYT